MRFSDQDLLQHTHLWQQMRYSMLCHAGPAMKWHSTYAATSRWSCLSSCSFNKFRKFSSAQWANRIFPSNLQDFFLWKIQVQPEKIPVVLAIHHKHRHGYKLHGSVRHCQWLTPTWKMQLFSLVANLQPTVVSKCSVTGETASVQSSWRANEGSPQSVTEGKFRSKSKGQRQARPVLLHFQIVQMEEQKTEEERAESEVNEPKEAAKEHKGNSFLNVHHGRCWATGIQGRSIPENHFVKLTEKDLGGWKRKDNYEKTIMTWATVLYVTVISVSWSITASVLTSWDWPRVQWVSFWRRKILTMQKCAAMICKGPQVAAERVYSSSCLDSTITIRNSDLSQSSLWFS